MTAYKVPLTVVKAVRDNEYLFLAAPVCSATPEQFDLMPPPDDIHVRYIGQKLMDVTVPPASHTRGLTAIVGKIGGKTTASGKCLDVQVNCHVWLLSVQAMQDVAVAHLNWGRCYWVGDPTG